MPDTLNVTSIEWMILFARGVMVVYGRNTVNHVKLLVKSCLDSRCVAHRKTVPLLNRRILASLWMLHHPVIFWKSLSLCAFVLIYLIFWPLLIPVGGSEEDHYQEEEEVSQANIVSSSIIVRIVRDEYKHFATS